MLSKQQKLISENPFYGLKSMLDLFQEVPRMTSPDKRKITLLLNNAWNEIKTITDAKRKTEAEELFFTLIFSIGDVTNRDHQLFGKNFSVEKGGMGMRESFRFSLEWMIDIMPNTFYKLIHLIPEYSNYENLFFNQLRTDRYKGTVISQEYMNVDYVKVAAALSKKAKASKTTDFELSLIAKFLPKVPVSKRYRVNKTGTKIVKEKQKATVEKDTRALRLIEAFSIAMEFEIKIYDNNIRFIGYEKWRSTYLKGTEAQMFSSREITLLDKTQFEDWLTKLPAGARYRVQRRLIEKTKTGELKPMDKWKLNSGENMGQIFLNWEKQKEEAMKYLTSLTEDEKNKMDKKDLVKLTKAAKVNTGGSSLYDIMVEFIQGNFGSGNNLLAQSLVDKIKLEVPVMVVSDVSSSMTFGERQVRTKEGAKFYPLDMARLATALFLYKNPNPDLQKFFLRFSDNCQIVMDGSIGLDKKSRFMTGRATRVETLCDPSKPFMQTYQNVVPQLYANGGTRFNSVASDLHSWANEESGNYFTMRKELIQQYPVWIVISDGDMNGAGSATETMRDFQMKMKQYFAFEPVVVVWDVSNSETSQDKSKFKNLENVMYFGGFNPQILNQVFLNINDIDIIDIYTPLRSLFLSNRYQPVRDAISGKSKVKSLITEDTINI